MELVSGMNIMTQNNATNWTLYGNNTSDQMTNQSLAHNTSTSEIKSKDEIAGKVIYRIVLPTICACGVLGIFLTVVVLSRKNMSTSTNCYLMGLAIADLLFLLLLSTLLGVSNVRNHHPGFYTASIFMTYASIFLNMFLMASIWLTVILAVERYIAICRPFLAPKMCTVRRAQIVIIVIFIFSISCRMPNFWEHHLASVNNPANNRTLVYLDQTGLAYNTYYTVFYPWLVDGVLASVLPFLLLLVINARLIWEVRKSTKYIQHNLSVAGAGDSIHREELQITTMLISVIIVFFICQAPYVIYTAITSINAFTPTAPIMLFRYITMLLLTLKSAINFILYCWFSEKFLTTLRCIMSVRNCTKTRTFCQNGSYTSVRRQSTFTKEINTCI